MPLKNVMLASSAVTKQLKYLPTYLGHSKSELLLFKAINLIGFVVNKSYMSPLFVYIILYSFILRKLLTLSTPQSNIVYWIKAR